MKTKNNYQQYICTYIKRRVEFKKKYGYASKRIQAKIDIWRKAIRRFEKRELALKKMDAAIRSFLNVSVFNSTHFRKGMYAKARCLFYKHCLENGIRASDVARYCGCKDINVPTKRRILFTQSFATNPENKELWHRFKQFINQQ